MDEHSTDADRPLRRVIWWGVGMVIVAMLLAAAVTPFLPSRPTGPTGPQISASTAIAVTANTGDCPDDPFRCGTITTLPRSAASVRTLAAIEAYDGEVAGCNPDGQVPPGLVFMVISSSGTRTVLDQCGIVQAGILDRPTVEPTGEPTAE